MFLSLFRYIFFYFATIATFVYITKYSNNGIGFSRIQNYQ